MYTCECGREFKTSRGMSVHQHHGCPSVVLDLYLEGLSIGTLMRRFNKNYEHDIHEKLRSEIDRRLASPASSPASQSDPSQ